MADSVGLPVKLPVGKRPVDRYERGLIRHPLRRILQQTVCRTLSHRMISVMQGAYLLLLLFRYQRDLSHCILFKHFPCDMIQHVYKAVYGIGTVESGIILIVIKYRVTFEADIHS